MGSRGELSWGEIYFIPFSLSLSFSFYIWTSRLWKGKFVRIIKVEISQTLEILQQCKWNASWIIKVTLFLSLLLLLLFLYLFIFFFSFIVRNLKRLFVSRGTLERTEIYLKFSFRTSEQITKGITNLRGKVFEICVSKILQRWAKSCNP